MIKKFSTLIVALASMPLMFAQNTICLGNNGEFCIGEPVEIEICPGGGGINSTVYTLNNPQSFNLQDDRYTGMINIGFPFEFYGNSYTQLAISDNGTVSFNSVGFQYCSWSVSNIPTTTASVTNSIMSVWQDLYQPHGGNIYFQTIGTAPNRIAVVLWEGLSMYSSSCQTPDLCFTGSVLLYEGTNIIETHVSNKTICTSWGGGRGTQGLNNSNGTIAHPVPGRNNSIFSIQNDGQRFTPNGPTDYTIDPIPFSVVTTDANPMIVWHDTNGESYPWNSGVLTTTVVAGTTGYFVASSTCGVGVGAISDTTFITGLSSSVTATGVDDMCSANIGSVTATPTGGTPPYTYNWPGLGSTNQTVNNVGAGTYTVEMIDGDGCVSSTTVTIGDTPASYPTSSTLVSCPEGADGTATVTMEPALGVLTYQWNDPNNQTSSTATGLAPGTYECVVTSSVGCSNTVEVTVDGIPGMEVQVTNVVDVSCNSGNDGAATVIVSAGTAPYSYSWDASASTAATANDLDFGTHTVTITDENGCVVTESIDIDQPAPLEVVQITDNSIICIGDSIMLTAQGGGGSSPYLYEWYTDGSLVANGQNVWVSPTKNVTEYCVVLTEQCGSPQAMACMKVSFPPEVVLMISSDVIGACFPVEVNFENETATTEGIDYTVWKYGDGKVDTIAGANDANHTFEEGVWDVRMTVVTDRGCVYEQDFPYLIEGYPIPEPNFYVTPNPASLYDPNVTAFSQSSPDIVSYIWDAEGASPAYSSQKNPTFKYPNETNNYPLTLTVENEYGCIDSLTRLVRIENDVQLFAPNTFTPDGDGFNDVWRVHILGVDVYDFQMTVFNRWGEVVFESFDPEGVWDGTYGGKIVPPGTYIWRIRALDYENDNKYEFDGYINVLR